MTAVLLLATMSYITRLPVLPFVTQLLGDRAGTLAVCKWFKKEGDFEDKCYKKDLTACKQSLRIVTKWNAHAFVNGLVQINIPKLRTFDPSRPPLAGRKALISST
jgi:hypothetical protein